MTATWVIDALKGKPAAVQLFNTLISSPLAMSAITYREVYEGVYYGRDRIQMEQSFSAFIRGFSVLPITQLIARRFAIVRGDLRQRGQRIGDPDVLIAATALHHNLTLVTQNKNYFARIPGLALY